MDVVVVVVEGCQIDSNLGLLSRRRNRQGKDETAASN